MMSMYMWNQTEGTGTLTHVLYFVTISFDYLMIFLIEFNRKSVYQKSNNWRGLHGKEKQ